MRVSTRTSNALYTAVRRRYDEESSCTRSSIRRRHKHSIARARLPDKLGFFFKYLFKRAAYVCVRVVKFSEYASGGIMYNVAVAVLFENVLNFANYYGVHVQALRQRLLLKSLSLSLSLSSNAAH